MNKVSIETCAQVVVRSFFAGLLTACSLASAQTATDIQVTSSVQQAAVNRLGVNLGDQSYWDSGQLLKNLTFRNPGFEGLKYRSILKCSAVTANTCMDDNQYSRQQTGFWTGGSYLILSGNSAGVTGTVALSTQNLAGCSGCGQIITFDQNINAAVGDYFVVTNYFPGSGDAGWWDNTQGGATITTELNDLSPNTPGKQALVLTASGSGQLASVSSYFDSYANHSFIQMNGSFQMTFRAKGIGGNNQLYVNVQRSQPGLGAYLSRTLTLTNAWQDYTLTFNANETGSAVGTVGMTLEAIGSTVELDDVSLEQTNSSAANPTVFRDDVVNALKELNPGTIRMMAAGAALGSDVINQLQPTYARYREGFNSSATSEDDVAYGIHEFLQLCATVGADPWITIPTATTPAEMTALIQYLTGTGSDTYSAMRIARGQTAPWTTVFNKIHLELGNETWNGDFKGESMGYPAYPQWANQVFGAARATSGFVASQFDLVLDGWSSAPGYTQIELSYSTQHDSVDIAPYLLYSLNNESQSLQFGAMFAEPEMWALPGGIVNRNLAYGQNATRPANLNVYEVNLGSIIGSPTQAQLDATQPSVGAGIAHADHMLQMMRLGVKYQNAFSLPQFEFLRGDGSTVHLWGLVIDMGTTNRRRPQFLTQALANSVIGGTMLQTVQTGANPTWNQPLSSDSVQLTGAHQIQSFAFNNNGNVSVVLFNLSQTTANAVTLSGANAPTGAVQMSQVTSANITDNNETANTVQTATQSLSGFNPANGITLPPFSMTVLTASGSATQAPSFSVAAGTYTAAQTVTISDPTAGATIYYSTDGSTPTVNSTAYASPVTISATETLQAIATAPNMTASAVSSAAYVIAQPVATAPVFSVAAGNYTSAQNVGMTDATAGATIYYTTDGSTPTSSSNVYSNPITVSVSETLQAIATAYGYTQSATTSASYVVSQAATAAPVFSIGGGSYTTVQTVAIADTMTNATIYFTTDGSTPTTGSNLYTAPITVSASETLQAIATASGYTQSAVSSASYVIAKPVAAAPVFSIGGGSYTAVQTVTIADTTTNATIYFTTDGSTPTTGSNLYTAPITVSASETLQAIATASGYTQSAVSSASYVIAKPVAAAPVFSIGGGNYTAVQTVAIADTTANAAIFYTTDGSTPTAGSTLYTAPITVSASETLQAIATASGYTQSAVSSASYVIAKPVAAAPVFSIGGGNYTAVQTVAIADTTANAAIYFTTDGSTPTTGSNLYTAPITVSASETLQAIATASGYTQSAVSSASYVIAKTVVIAPVFSIGGGNYTSAQTVVITDGNPAATIYYILNGTPTAGWNLYTAPITVSASETLQAMATASGYTQSAVSSASYVIAKPVTTAPVFSVGGGNYTGALTVTIADATTNAAIYYTIDGSTPTASSNVYANPIAVTATMTLRAVAIAPGYTQSAVASASYGINKLTAATPSFSIRAATYTSTQAVSITDATPGASIFFTTNGATPTNASTKYAGPIEISESVTLKAIAVASNYNASTVASASYSIVETAPTALPTFSVTSGTYTAPQTVEITDPTAGAAIYYSINGSNPTTSSTRYVTAIQVDATVTLKAIAVAAKHTQSGMAIAAYSIVELPATVPPTFSLKPGTFTAPQAVVLKAATAGSVIYFTVNGTNPTPTSERYNNPIEVAATETIKAIALAPKHTASAATSATYTIEKAAEPAAAAPAFSVKSGIYTTTQMVALGDKTEGATIFISVNGSKSQKYTTPIEVTKTTTIKAIASAANHTNSNEVVGVFTIEALPTTATPTFTVKPGTYTAAQTVALKDATAGSTILVSVNGGKAVKFVNPIEVTKTTTIKAIASAASHRNSNEAVGLFTIEALPVTATPTFTVKPGTYTAAQTVALKDATAGSTILVSVNGGKAVKFVNPIEVTKTTTIKAIASAASHSNSNEVVGLFTIEALPITATPTFTVKPGTYTAAQTVALKDATSGSTILVSVNGGKAVKFVNPIEVTKTTTIKAIASAANHTNSNEVVGIFTIGTLPETATPTFTVKPGTYTAAQTVALKDATAGSTILVSVNGGKAVKFVSPIVVTKNTTIKAIASAPSHTNSNETVGVYVIQASKAEPKAATPTFSVNPGTYPKQQTVALKDATPGAEIFVSVNGSQSMRYENPIVVTKTTTIKAIATAANYSSSSEAAGQYVIEAATAAVAVTPTFSLKPGTYGKAQTVALQDATTGAEIVISINGGKAVKYTAPIQVTKTTTIKAIAQAAKYITSTALEGTFTITTTAASKEEEERASLGANLIPNPER